MENEEKIKELVTQKHQLQQKCVSLCRTQCCRRTRRACMLLMTDVQDDADRNYHKALDQCSNQEQETKRKFAGQMKLMEEEKARDFHYTTRG